MRRTSARGELPKMLDETLAPEDMQEAVDLARENAAAHLLRRARRAEAKGDHETAQECRLTAEELIPTCVYTCQECDFQGQSHDAFCEKCGLPVAAAGHLIMMRLEGR